MELDGIHSRNDKLRIVAVVRYVPGAEPPVNRGEQNVISYLKERLPEDYRIFPGVQIIHRDRADDIDVLILTPHALVVGEIKDIAGNLVIDNGACYVNDNLRPQPFNATNAKARRLKSRLQDADPRLRDVWVSPLVILARDPASLRLNPPILNEGVMTMDRAVEKMTTPSRLLPRPPYRQLGDLTAGIERVLNLQRGRDRNVRFGAYRCAELLDRTDDEDLWSAEHSITQDEVEIRHIGRNPATRDNRVREAEGELAAFAALADSPWIDGPREVLPQDDGSITLIYGPRQGATLAELLDADEAVPSDRVLLDVTSALDAAHRAGVSHGRLAPRWIEVLPDVVKVRGFSLARGEGVPAATRLLGEDEVFLAPEMLRRKTTGAPADIYALGKLIELLKPEDDTMQALAERLSRSDIAERQLPAGYILEALAGAFGVQEAISAGDAAGQSADLDEPATPVDSIEYGPDGLILLGSVIGSFVVTDYLGSGGFSDVYRAQHTIGNRAASIKVFKESEAEALVAHEFKVLQEVEDPNVVSVIDAGHSPAGWYMISEFLDGDTISQRIDAFDGTADAADAALIGYEILNALATIHEQGIYHRDVKPENVILVDNRGAVLFDFGVAATQRDQIVGLTWPYWPPGVPGDIRSPDPDLFAVGIVLCELLTGQHPYPDGNPHDGERPDVSSLPPGMAGVLERAIDPTAAVRFQTAGEFRDALEPYVDTTRKITASRRGLYRRVEMLIAEGKLDEAELLCLPEWKRLIATIQRKRRVGTGKTTRVAGLDVGAPEEGTGLVHGLDGSGPHEAKTWTYQVSGKPGLMVDVQVSEDVRGEIKIATIDPYDSSGRLQQLKGRLRHGIRPEGSGLTMRLRLLTRPEGKLLGQRQPSSLAELNDDAGIDVRQLLLDAGAIEMGRRGEVGLGEPSRTKNEVAVIMPKEERNDIALRAYLLTTVVPLAREMDLLLQDS